jgi:hypothetical protein
LKKAWKDVEDRSEQVPFDLPKGALVRIEKEYINRDAILHFMQYTAARRVRHTRGHRGGSLASSFAALLARGMPLEEGSHIYVITVIYVMIPHEGKPTRWFSGTLKLPLVPPVAVRQALSMELQRRTPRSAMGRSAFFYGKLVRSVARQGLHVMDVDIEKCHMSLRMRRLYKEGMAAQFPLYQVFVEEGGAKAFHKVLSHEVSVAEGDVKQLLISLSNGGTVDK